MGEVDQPAEVPAPPLGSAVPGAGGGAVVPASPIVLVVAGPLESPELGGGMVLEDWSVVLDDWGVVLVD